MIDDIVELPRPMSRIKQGATLASFAAYEQPTSEMGMALGISTEVKDLPICIGNEFKAIAGPFAPFRYKFIEHDQSCFREYMVISDGPYGSKDSKFFTLWVNKVDKKSLKTEKFYCWNIIAAARQYFGFQDCELLCRSAFEKTLLAGHVFNMPSIEKAYRWSHNCLESQDDESQEIRRMMMLQANLDVVDEAMISDDWFDPMDVYRGVVKESKPFSLITGAGRILTRNAVSSGDIRHLIGPEYVIKPYHNCLRKVKSFDPRTNYWAMCELSGWFEVLKYIELIPYSELFVTISKKHPDVMRVNDPYDSGRFFDLELDKLNEDDRAPLSRAIESIRNQTHEDSFELYRSWGEEVYITTLNQDCKTKQFYYFDLVHAALGSQMFVPINS